MTLPQKIRGGDATVAKWSPKDMDEWSEMWRNNETQSIMAANIWADGNKSPTAGLPEWLGPKDFELKKPESNVFGVNAALIGPGQPYHQWKKSPQAAEWERQISGHFAR